MLDGIRKAMVVKVGCNYKVELRAAIWDGGFGGRNLGLMK